MRAPQLTGCEGPVALTMVDPSEPTATADTAVAEVALGADGC